MRYENITQGIFLERPNRFIAYVDIDGVKTVCHVKNTGRCKELLVAGARVILEKSNNPLRKTAYDLIAVYKGDMLINIDSVAPNKVFGEWAEKSGFFGDISYIKPECVYKNSRFDYYIEAQGKRIFVEVKGVTLENDGVLSFPDAPTERGIKHLNELAEAVKDGYGAYVFFVVQMEECKYFTPNVQRHKEFAVALRNAANNGVEVRCLTCKVLPDQMDIFDFAEVRI
ncbi:MAG: DNA/RNA nuclease SfsA [Clostridia bacterium]|nr:DNA/RNA nuclease SfsA [Clostridia bacterium]MBR5278550.1 DNA/RNA nuclease SfsA [Clostridia bacterium]